MLNDWPTGPYSMVLVALSVVLLPTAAAAGRDCAAEMEVPQLRPAIVNMTGEVFATVKIDGRGRAKSIRIKTAPNGKVLANEIEFLLRVKTKYLRECSGESVDFLFAYTLEGEPCDFLQWRVIYRPPNRYTIVSRPLKPMAEYAPK
jgi:hypothetical protein